MLGHKLGVYSLALQMVRHLKNEPSECAVLVGVFYYCPGSINNLLPSKCKLIGIHWVSSLRIKDGTKVLFVVVYSLSHV